MKRHTKPQPHANGGTVHVRQYRDAWARSQAKRDLQQALKARCAEWLDGDTLALTVWDRFADS